MALIYHLIEDAIHETLDDTLKCLAEFVEMEATSLSAVPTGQRRDRHTHPEDWMFADTAMLCSWRKSESCSGMELNIRPLAVEVVAAQYEPVEFIGFSRKHWTRALELRASRGPYFVIAAGGTLVDITNWDCICNRIYSCEVYE